MLRLFVGLFLGVEGCLKGGNFAGGFGVGVYGNGNCDKLRDLLVWDLVSTFSTFFVLMFV